LLSAKNINNVFRVRLGYPGNGPGIESSLAGQHIPSVYSTSAPVIVDIASDGVKDIVFPNFIRHSNVLDGPFPNIINNINFDGEPDIGVKTFNGELIWLTKTGMPLLGYRLIQPLNPAPQGIKKLV
jgi:hypothetical protein